MSASRISNPASGVIFLEHQSVSSLLKRLPWLPTTFKIKSKFPWPQPIFDHLGPHTLPGPSFSLTCPGMFLPSIFPAQCRVNSSFSLEAQCKHHLLPEASPDFLLEGSCLLHRAMTAHHRPRWLTIMSARSLEVTSFAFNCICGLCMTQVQLTRDIKHGSGSRAASGPGRVHFPSLRWFLPRVGSGARDEVGSWGGASCPHSAPEFLLVTQGLCPGEELSFFYLILHMGHLDSAPKAGPPGTLMTWSLSGHSKASLHQPLWTPGD